MSAPLNTRGRASGSRVSMKTVAVVALKGGTGKTTVAVNLAVTAHLSGRKVILADMDPQASALQWAKAREREKRPGPTVLPLKPGSIGPAREAALAAGFDLLVIDTRAATEADALAAARVADLCLIVVRPTPIDIKAIAHTVALLKPLRRPCALVVNQAPSQRVGREPAIVDEAVELLVSYGLPISPAGLRSRQVFQAAFSRGLIPVEIEGDSRASQEVLRLWDFTASRLWTEAARTQASPQRAVRPEPDSRWAGSRWSKIAAALRPAH